MGISIAAPNDLLGVSYIKAILKNGFKIQPVTIQRTNDFHDLSLDEQVVSASNVRNRLLQYHFMRWCRTRNKYVNYITSKINAVLNRFQNKINKARNVQASK